MHVLPGLTRLGQIIDGCGFVTAVVLYLAALAGLAAAGTFLGRRAR